MAKKQEVDTKTAKLRRMADRGGTPNERSTAKRLLDAANLPVPRAEEVDDQWTGQGWLTRTRGDGKAYLRGAELRHFLSHVKDGQIVTNRTIPLSDTFGSSAFYMVLSFLLKHDLVVKMGSRYQIGNKQEIVACWNRYVEMMKL